ncbi:MAG: PDZ domain-containing protein [Desulfuromonadales bacterium]|nr:PDZ domain-containing protein [Desulfuromonadales bacterium]NIR33401.1 PDZ domain-containing protein [Desulfuromonadales bacterium]NIS43390.1 PDZ domain-containing protein [Desulfuromonadales bacterium]
MTARFRYLLLTGLLLLPLVGGCAQSTAVIGNPQAPYDPPKPPEVGDIFHIPTGYYVSEEQMLAAVDDARIVYVGETHDNPAAHRVQLTILEAMAESHPGKVALGLEMFTPAQQEVLDRWVAGELSEKDFLKESEWFMNWTMDFGLYRDILVFARDRGIPVVGLNVEKSLKRKVGMQGLEALTEEERQRVPELDMGDPYQKAMTKAIFKGHDAGDAMLESFLRVQTLWDESMAANIADFLSQAEHEGYRMVVMAGGNHVRFGYGIPRRVFRRLPTSYVLVGSKELKVAEDRRKKDRVMDVDLPHLPMQPYDYVVFTEYEELESDKAQLGVQFEANDEGIVVLAVVPESAAAEAGIEKGDVLIAIDQEPLEDSFDLIYEIGRHQPGDEVTISFSRGGEKMSAKVVLKERHHGMKTKKHGKKN